MIGYWRTAAICVALALAACSVTAPISNSPVRDQLSQGPIGRTIEQGLVDAEWNLDQAIAVGALPADDPADACLHQSLTKLGLEPSSATLTSTPPSSFTPRVSDLISAGAALYIRARQAQQLGVGGAITLPTNCKAVVGQFLLDAAAAGKNLLPGGGIGPTIQ